MVTVISQTSDGDFAVVTIEVATGEVTVLTDDDADDCYRAWSPNGDVIADTATWS